MLSPTILYVEDDDDIRSVVTQALTFEGFDVTAVSSAEDALKGLAARTYQLLLTDYRLPKENAAWLLREATGKGLLEKTPVIVFSAEIAPQGIEGYLFLRKPIDLDVLSAAIARTLADHVSHEVSACGQKIEPEKLALTLYVTTRSHVSQKAIRNLRRILQKFDPSKIALSVCDVATGDALAQSLEADRIVVTPTLVVRMPGPNVWIAGDLSDAALVEEVVARGLATLLPDAR
jgi:DNA-binding NtrC family response regulator